MHKATSSLLRFIWHPERTESPDWWTYFGSFGNDIFGDEDTQMRSASTPDESAFPYGGVRAQPGLRSPLRCSANSTSS